MDIGRNTSSVALDSIDVAVIGVGYWGPNLVRVLHELGCRVHVYDKDENRSRLILEQYPDSKIMKNLQSILSDDSIETVVIAVPLPDHFELVRKCLDSGKHVFVEKPLCWSTVEAEELSNHKNGYVLMVGHITSFSPGIIELTSRIKRGEIGELRHLSLRRTHLGPIYRSTDVLTEVAAHDIAIMLSVVDTLPVRVNAWGIERLQFNTPDRAILVLAWKNGLICKVEVAWSSGVRRRRILAEGMEGTLVLQSDYGSEKLTHFTEAPPLQMLRNGKSQKLVNSALSTSEIPLKNGEPLKAEIYEFLASIKEKRNPIVDLEFGRKVVKILEAARASLENQGMTVELNK
ncbi:Gfo/Idh/MocA family oxidoreductase [bacterium]|nr:Gfo/Idh/MocA family oxidoreductase [bacterium]